MYDVAIIGAGINGVAMSHELTQAGKKVILFDKEGVAAGGSGAAGAFISPKFSKSGELKEILHEAFNYSMDFYSQNFPQQFRKEQLLHLAKDEKDAEILRIYKEQTPLELLELSHESVESISLYAGVVNAQAMCKAMAKSATFKKEHITSLEFSEGSWLLNEEFMAKEVILATGAYKSTVPEPYIQLRGVWGHRIDIRTTTDNPYSIHQFVSISPSYNGELSIGATHNVHYHPESSKEPYDLVAGREELLQKASQTLKLENVEVIKDYTGLRSGSFDYMPLVGPLVMSKETLQNSNINFKVKKADHTEYTLYPNLYMINGSGGYGFVLAPYLAKILSQHILSAQEISPRLTPARFFARWAKKL